MNSTNYEITCGDCGATRIVQIIATPVGERVDWLEEKYDGPQQIISGRPRLDGQWGWQCLCGNNDLMTKQEINSMENQAAPTPKELNEIVANLQVQKSKFALREL